MKYLLLLLFFILPAAAQATKLANCDQVPFDVTIVNGGQKRVATLTPAGGSVEEFGPTVSFQLAGQPPVAIVEQFDEYCIWHGKITLQRRNVGNGASGGFGLR